ncbi:WSC-domain-containing protein [Pholiota conissans]|uniref:WSC-domain-containing protein n=1 Tax=Pholiota conissans TaxID=109636 RepID=A0A9P6CSS9_9AGAR|nr:WSC-domain-containing protein [Pholiota conissans]
MKHLAISFHFLSLLTVTEFVVNNLSTKDSLLANASPSVKLPPDPQPGWQYFGCFRYSFALISQLDDNLTSPFPSDTASNRTLKTAAYTDVTNMTITSCIAFCTPSGYKYAGVEYSRECCGFSLSFPVHITHLEMHLDCDNIIEAPGVPISEDDCNMPCTGSSDDICGGSSAISVFSSTSPAPPVATIKTTVGSFQYKGCFEDGVLGNAPRTLSHWLTINSGVTAESCTTGCKAAGYALAGVEYGQECWCDSYMEIVTLAPDSECNMPCQADGTEICGAGNRLVVYQDTTATPPSTQQCLTNSQLYSTSYAFTLHAVPIQGGVTYPLGSFELSAVGNYPSWFLLSNGQAGSPPDNNGPYEATTFMLSQTTGIRPTGWHGEESPYAIKPNVGCAQVFAIAYTNPITTYSNYCAMPNSVSIFGPFIGPAILGINGRADQWGLCPNITYESYGRLDVVFSPVATNPDYVLSSCESVVLVMQ